ncbi:peptide ABC transporter ATP-binding protein [Candidatus Marinamargulisbacteria bacterium SCGC AG-343-D04]|nr:peptide ABC transporter ATP-binding protein [Candidatus Marinamargulisbacteria bacterium SCGC AG-343-D04]
MLSIRNLDVEFHSDQSRVHAVKGISYELSEGQTLGIVGESGSGKSVSSLSILKLLPSTARVSGEVFWKGTDLIKETEAAMRLVRGAQIGYIFQNPLSALNPVFTVANQMVETICLHSDATKEEALEEAIELLDKVKIENPRKRIHDYPHQFSLGMCQRIMIAMTLSMKPDLLIADEPTASLDVTTQKEILELMDSLKEEYQMSMILISHDLGVVAERCDEVAVMYLGEIVEMGTPKDIFGSPKEAYTKILIDAIPKIRF